MIIQNRPQHRLRPAGRVRVALAPVFTVPAAPGPVAAAAARHRGTPPGSEATPNRGAVGGRGAATALVAATLAHSIAVAWLLGQATAVPAGAVTPTSTPFVSTLAQGPAPLSGPSAPAAVPVGLLIPAIGVDEHTLVGLGRNPDGSLQVPADFARAGWFTGGSVPGRPGPSVIAGHVDSWRGPAVFFRLRELRPGDVVAVRMSDGGAVRFRVDGVQRYPKSAFPTNAVYGPVPGAALRLITCGGAFDRDARSYVDNIVVYASERP